MNFFDHVAVAFGLKDPPELVEMRNAVSKLHEQEKQIRLREEGKLPVDLNSLHTLRDGAYVIKYTAMIDDKPHFGALIKFGNRIQLTESHASTGWSDWEDENAINRLKTRKSDGINKGDEFIITSKSNNFLAAQDRLAERRKERKAALSLGNFVGSLTMYARGNLCNGYASHIVTGHTIRKRDTLKYIIDQISKELPN